MVRTWADLSVADPLTWQHTPPTDRTAGPADTKEIPGDGVLFGCLVAQVAVGAAVKRGQCFAAVGISREDDALAANVIGTVYNNYLIDGMDTSEFFIFPVKAHTFAYLVAYNSVADVEVQATLSWMRS